MKRGWLRWTQKKIVDASNKLLYYIQCTMWMDRKQVGIIYDHLVQPPGECSTLRYDRSKKAWVAVPSHPVVPDYVYKMKGVDKTDRSMADYDVSLKSTKYYLRIFWYTFTSAIANMRVTTFELVRQVKEQSNSSLQCKTDPWEKYTKGSKGVFNWMLDMGHAVMERRILMVWDPTDPTSDRPSWMRQKPFLPCGCRRCFFCK